MSETVNNVTSLPTEEVPTLTVIKHLARKTAKVAIIGAAVVGGYVLVQRARATSTEEGELSAND